MRRYLRWLRRRFGKPTLLAAKDGPWRSKLFADYVCDGTADLDLIKRGLGETGHVCLGVGTFGPIETPLAVREGQLLEGAGPKR